MFFSAVPVEADPISESTPRRFGLWAEAEGTYRPFDTRDEFQRFSEFTGNHGFTDIYCQVYRNGRSWFPSLLADPTPYYEARERGLDPLGEAIRIGHERGQRVHAWVNALRVKSNSDAPLLRSIGRSAVQVDNYGSSILDYREAYKTPPGPVGRYYSIDTPGIWLDPSSRSVRRYVVETIRDLVLSYPDLDGIHLDMIRFPFGLPTRGNSQRTYSQLRFGYSPSSLEGFRDLLQLAMGDSAATLPKPLTPKSIRQWPEKWDTWRRSQVTLLVQDVRELLRQIAPRMELSIAGIARGSRAYGSAMQEWPKWVNAGVIDYVLPMAYTADAAIAQEYAEFATSNVQPDRVVLGIGAWLLLNRLNNLETQINRALSEGAGGIALFSYSNLRSKKGEKLARIAAQAFSTDAAESVSR
ncbi:MAG: family 10 glycosylhydrolase [Bdellovibrionales bacterium]|nr:family 10 glycosylhydrolase [Bdellovibrionales bacterium]